MFSLLHNRMAFVVVVAAFMALSHQRAGAVTVTLFHNNDGESKLLAASNGSGGAANYVGLLNQLRSSATTDTTLTLSSGDNFLAGTAFNASLQNGVFYDAIALNAIQYDAIALGNHDFDFGPQVLANFINSPAWTDPTPPTYLSSNVDFTGEPALQALVNSGRIAASTIVEKQVGPNTERFGIVGAVTPTIKSISSPGNVVINDVLSSVQSEVDSLISQGVNKIILVSHLQNIQEELNLIPQLRGVDVVIAGGGDNLLANAGTPLLPGEIPVQFPYPVVQNDADNKQVLVVTTTGEYRYIGKLEVNFDAAGNASLLGGGPVRVLAADGITPDAFVQQNVVAPVQASIASLAANVVTTSEVPLDGRRDSVRNFETNLGNLATDALLWQANELAASFGVAPATIALQNGGGIRNNNVIPAGNITELDTFNILPFANFVSIVEGVTPQTLKLLLENAVSELPGGGRFAQIAGFNFVYDPKGTPMIINDQTLAITQQGNRIIDVLLEDGTAIIRGGQIVPNAPTINIATIDFLARGGDEYPFGGLPFTTLGVTYQQALFNFLTFLDQTGGITAAAYPVGGESRITTVVPEPTSAVLLLIGCAGLLSRRRNVA